MEKLKTSNILLINLFIFVIIIFNKSFANYNSLETLNLKNLNEIGQNITFYQINDSTYFGYKKFQFKDPFIGFFRNFNDFLHTKYSALNVTLLGISTLLLIKYDQKIVDKAREIGDKIGIPPTDNKLNILPLDHVPLYVPTDLASGLYYIGDGWTHIALTLSIGIYGKVKNNIRAYNTAFQLAQGLMMAGAYSQIIKHITGRESPFKATVPGGRWRLFPNQIDYHKHVPAYDAYPSGHVAATMMTIVILSENYPEKKWIKPVGYTLMSLLMFQMLNNGVHWASDYPLSIAMSYSIGKMIVNSYRVKAIKKGDNFELTYDPRFYPSIRLTGNKKEIGLTYNF